MVGNVCGNIFAYILMSIVGVVWAFYCYEYRIYQIVVMDGMEVFHGYLLA